MIAKTIAFSGGPLSGQFMEIQDHATMYKIVVLEPHRKPLEDKVIQTNDKFYYKSKYKFGAAEVFIWEEDI